MKLDVFWGQETGHSLESGSLYSSEGWQFNEIHGT